MGEGTPQVSEVNEEEVSRIKEDFKQFYRSSVLGKTLTMDNPSLDNVALNMNALFERARNAGLDDAGVAKMYHEMKADLERELKTQK